MDTNRNKIKVLFITHCSAMGGGNHSMMQLIIELRDKYNIEPIVLAHDDIAPLVIQDKCKENNIRCITAKFYWFKGKKNLKQYIAYFLNVLLYYPIIFYKLKGIEFDLIHSNGSVIDIGAWISRVKNVKHIWHLREFGDLDFSLYPVFGEKWEKKVYRNGDCFIAISQAVKNAFLRVIPEEKIKLVYNGISLENYNQEATHSNSIIQFVMVGTIQPTKNQLEALQAFNLLIKRGYKAYINFFGFHDEKYLNILKKYTHDNNIEEWVNFCGVSKNINSILKKMDIGLMLSKNEAFGRVTVEYMLQNLAVIVSNSGANTEIVKDGYSGLVYQLGNIEDLTNKMQQYIDRRDFMIKIAEQGKKEAIRRFSSEENTNQIYNIYKEITL